MDRFGDWLTGMMTDAFVLLARDAMIEAVRSAQVEIGGPVTANEARLAAARAGRHLGRNVRAFSELAERVAALGSDADGKALHLAGQDACGRRLWWVEQTTEPTG